VEFPFRTETPELPEVLDGDHWLTAATVNQQGMRTWSSPVLITGRESDNAAQFASEDRTSGGAWGAMYGRDGYFIAGDSTNPPARASISISAANVFFWNADVNQNSSLTRQSSGRVAAAWFNSSAQPVRISLSFPDGNFHQAAFYLADFDDGGRKMIARAIDSDTGSPLGTRSVSSFRDGCYLKWRVRGNVTFEFICENGTAVVSGVFIDPGVRYVDWEALNFGVSDSLSSQDADPDNDRKSNLMEFLTGSNPLRREPLWACRYDSESDRTLFEIALARNRTGVAPLLEISNDLKTWAQIDPAKVEVRTRVNETQQIWEYRFDQTVSEVQQFLRLRAVSISP
jgi:hypothetical protein